MSSKIAPSYIVNFNHISLILIFVFSSLSCFSQKLKSINIEEIPQRKVRNYIVSREIDQMQNFSSIHASWNRENNESDFKLNEKIFYLNYKLSDVWESYWQTNPAKMWNGTSIRLGLLISKYSNSVIYVSNSFFPEIDTGQVYFIDLRLMKGLFNVPVAFEIINIDQKRLIVEISYIDDNKSKGKQTIQFFENGDGRTRIVHRSYFKSNSWFHDDILYPYFHKKFIKEFHKNIRKLVENNWLPKAISK
jgi:hypothetical protein